MLTIFESILLGHIVGDFFLQNKWMAVNKSASHFKTFIHCALYTLAIALFTNFNPVWLVAVFIPHFLIDRYSLADKYLDFIKGRSLPDYVYNGHKNIPKSSNMAPAEAYAYNNNYWALRGGFHAVVYTVVDNGMHIFCMLAAYKLIF